LSQIFGSVAAEDVGNAELNRLEGKQSVQKILAALGEESLPGPDNIRRRRIDSEDPISMTKVSFPYGTLSLIEYNDNIGTMFTFAKDDRENVPSSYRSMPTVDAALVETEDDILFRRFATESEKETLLSAIDLDDQPENVSAYTDSSVDGFWVEVGFKTSTTDKRVDVEQYFVEGGFLNNFDARRQEIPAQETIASQFSARLIRNVETGETATGSTETTQVGTQDIRTNKRQVLEELILDWAGANIAGFVAGEVFGVCGGVCVNCVDLIWGLFDCLSCNIVCGTGLTPAGAVVCVFCIYLWCGQDPLSAVECLSCGECLIEGETTNNPREDIYSLFPDPIQPPSWLS